MKGKNNYTWRILLILAICLCTAVGFFAGKNAGQTELRKEQETLYELNRAGIQNLGAEEGKTIYVIGHKSPDTDTVCSAIGYARLLTMLGYPAEAGITMNVNNETAYVLKQAGVAVPPILEDV
nr:DHH family phosphoesterase [Oscillospiraceae bacterium]